MKFIAIFDGYWGKADTVDKACDRAEAYGMSIAPSSHVIVYEMLDDDAYVNEKGIVIYEPIIGDGQDEALEVFKGLMQHLVVSPLYDRPAGAWDETEAAIIEGNKNIPVNIIQKAADLAREEESITCS